MFGRQSSVVLNTESVSHDFSCDVVLEAKPWPRGVSRPNVYGLGLPSVQGWKKPRFFGIFLIGFLGFNVHSAEHRCMTHDK